MTRASAVTDPAHMGRDLSRRQRDALRILAATTQGAHVYDSGRAIAYDPATQRMVALDTRTVAALIGRGLAGRRNGAVHATAEGIEVARVL